MKAAPKADRHKAPQVVIRAPAEEIDAWRDAAAAAGETLTEWLREAARDRLSRCPRCTPTETCDSCLAYQQAEREASKRGQLR